MVLQFQNSYISLVSIAKGDWGRGTIARWDFVISCLALGDEWFTTGSRPLTRSQNILSTLGWGWGQGSEWEWRGRQEVCPGDIAFFPLDYAFKITEYVSVWVFGWYQCVHILSGDTHRNSEYCRESDKVTLSFVVLGRPLRVFTGGQFC